MQEEQREKFRIVRTVLEQGGQFSGINRKVQLKPVKWGMPGAGNSSTTPEHSGNEHDGNASASSGGGAGAGSGIRVPVVKELLLILKYGGVLTHAGRKQAEELGKQFRMIMYPNSGPNGGGGGLLRLHSTYRHDLKIYSSDEVSNAWKHPYSHLQWQLICAAAAWSAIPYACCAYLQHRARQQCRF